jgi:putative transposase
MVDYAVGRGASVRRACALLTVSRSALRYESRMPARDKKLGRMLEAIARRRPTYGHRFAWGILTEHRGWVVNLKRVHRVWRARGLVVRRKKGKKIRTGQPRVLAPTGANQVWAYDFVHDRCASGQALKILTVVDEWTRESLAIEVASSMRAVRVIAVLERLFAQYGTPAVPRSDNGPEFIARALKLWTVIHHSETATIEPGKPWQNGSVESFNGTLRRECLDREWFSNLREARIVIEQYRWEYNTQRPHSSLGYRTPAQVGAAARTAMTQGSAVHEIELPGASSETDLPILTTENLS